MKPLQPPMTNRVKEFRTRHRRSISQDELGTLVGVSRQTIVAIESGRHNPSVYLALKLAEVLDTSVEDLFQLGDRDPGMMDTPLNPVMG